MKKQNKGTTRTFTRRFYFLVLSGTIAIIGFVMFINYVLTLNMAMGGPGVVMLAAGVLVFRYYWKKEDNLTIDHVDGVKKDTEANSVTIYRDRIVFNTLAKPEGFPMQCLNDNKKYYVNIWDETIKRIVPFILPDQQYYDPIVFAQRVLGLPAHRKIFERKPKLIEKLKTALLVAAIAIVWLLILTTTGEA